MSRERVCLMASALNEAAALPKFFETHSWADEIIILDSGSTDNSKAVTEKYQRRLVHKPLNANHNQREQWALSQTTCDWIFLIDPDEFIMEPLKEEICAILENGTPYSAFTNVRVNFFMGHALRHGGWSGSGLKFYRRDSVSFEGSDFHEQPLIRGEIGTLRGEVHHYPNPNIHWILQKFNYISEFDCKSYFDQYGRLSEKKFQRLLLSKPLKNFWKSYLKKKGYKDGIHGLIYAAMILAFDIIRICKYGERYLIQNPNRISSDKLPDPWEYRCLDKRTS